MRWSIHAAYPPPSPPAVDVTIVDVDAVVVGTTTTTNDDARVTRDITMTIITTSTNDVIVVVVVISPSFRSFVGRRCIIYYGLDDPVLTTSTTGRGGDGGGCVGGGGMAEEAGGLHELLLESSMNDYPSSYPPPPPDKRLKLSLNGNRRVIGTLRGYDAFLNVVLENAIDESTGADLCGGGVGGEGGVGGGGEIVIRGNSIVQFESIERWLWGGDGEGEGEGRGRGGGGSRRCIYYDRDMLAETRMGGKCIGRANTHAADAVLSPSWNLSSGPSAVVNNFVDAFSSSLPEIDAGDGANFLSEGEEVDADDYNEAPLVNDACPPPGEAESAAAETEAAPELTIEGVMLLNVAWLKDELKRRGRAIAGKKGELQACLKEAIVLNVPVASGGGVSVCRHESMAGLDVTVRWELLTPKYMPIPEAENIDQSLRPPTELDGSTNPKCAMMETFVRGSFTGTTEKMWYAFVEQSPMAPPKKRSRKSRKRTTPTRQHVVINIEPRVLGGPNIDFLQRYGLDEAIHPMDWFTAFMPMTPDMNHEDAAAVNVKGDQTTKFAVSNWTGYSNAKAMLCKAGDPSHIFTGKFKPFKNEDIMQMLAVYIIDGLAPSPQLIQKMQDQERQPTHGNDRIAAVIAFGVHRAMGGKAVNLPPSGIVMDDIVDNDNYAIKRKWNESGEEVDNEKEVKLIRATLTHPRYRDPDVDGRGGKGIGGGGRGRSKALFLVAMYGLVAHVGCPLEAGQGEGEGEGRGRGGEEREGEGEGEGGERGDGGEEVGGVRTDGDEEAEESDKEEEEEPKSSKEEDEEEDEEEEEEEEEWDEDEDEDEDEEEEGGDDDIEIDSDGDDDFEIDRLSDDNDDFEGDFENLKDGVLWPSLISKYVSIGGGGISSGGGVDAVTTRQIMHTLPLCPYTVEYRDL
ncbi:hypothetical protein ACHAXA_009042 [Cyclostephanos tholiformis]|uniref:Sm protein G n=1 Tax=Cyclostephanos tholiformis TaxID=382380 RepID=A0ABD3RY67_9STRA